MTKAGRERLTFDADIGPFVNLTHNSLAITSVAHGHTTKRMKQRSEGGVLGAGLWQRKR